MNSLLEGEPELASDEADTRDLEQEEYLSDAMEEPMPMYLAKDLFEYGGTCEWES